jgi:hypothetical protein
VQNNKWCYELWPTVMCNKHYNFIKTWRQASFFITRFSALHSTQQLEFFIRIIKLPIRVIKLLIGIFKCCKAVRTTTYHNTVFNSNFTSKTVRDSIYHPHSDLTLQSTTIVIWTNTFNLKHSALYLDYTYVCSIILKINVGYFAN